MRKRLLRAFVERGHLDSHDAKDIVGYAHGGGSSVDAGLRIEEADCVGLALLRLSTLFFMDRPKQRDVNFVHCCGKYHTEPIQSDKYSGERVLTPLELIDRIAQLVPQPRTHRHRYYGVLAPNSPLRATVTAMAPVAQLSVPMVAGSPVTEDVKADAETTGTVTGVAVVVGGSGGAGNLSRQPNPNHIHHRTTCGRH